MVGNQEKSGEWEEFDDPGIRSDYGDRCFIDGMGAVCKGIQTGGLWSQIECRNHINYLEPLAAVFAVKSFVKDRRDAHVHLRMDNRTAVFYVNHMGGTHSPVMSRLATQL